MSGDELAVTETATPAAKAREERVDKQIGRYRILREIGAGGMGVVYAAFDPELERNVALKVVRPGVSSDAKQRLLREGRAMARLSHPNVVAVYEVGSADGRDYIAMELIDGQNLVDWLATKPGPVAALDAFIAAGQGLATAHEASIVHRDFKPHNVLRSRRGRVMVTDFGLARESTIDLPASRDTQPLDGLTLTGAVLGTPAYMAPEQWQGGEVTPATDQFAFSVALVEALSGARPFRGDSADELRDAVMRGPDRLDLSRVPRRLRAVLRRGMATDPARRWPSMHALLAHLHRRSRIVWVGLAALAVVAAVVAAIALRRPAAVIAAGPTCDAPILAPATVWNADADREIRSGLPKAADLLASTFARWTAVRATVCQQSGANRATKLACLDKVLLRIDAMKRARQLVPKENDWGLYAQLFPPDVCMLDEPPHMPSSYSDAVIAGLALRSEREQELPLLQRVRTAAASDACGRMYVAWFEKFDGDHLDRTRSLAQLCGDDQAYSTATLNWLDDRIGPYSDMAKSLEIDGLERIVERTANPFVTQLYLVYRGQIARSQDDLDGAIGFYRRAQGGTQADSEANRRRELAKALLWRGAPGDLAAADRELAALRGMWTPEMGDVRDIDSLALSAVWLAGDVRAAHAGLVESFQRRYGAAPDGPAASGTVVDATGAPVAGATVAAGVELVGDAAGPGVELFDPHALHASLEHVQFATTDAHGSFAFEHVYARSELVAQRGAERSLARPAGAKAVLALAPTRTIRGRIASRGTGIVLVEAVISGQRATIAAPVSEDGSYELAGLPMGAVSARVARIGLYGSVRGPLAPVDAVAAPNRRAFDVTLRGLTVNGGFVWVFGGSVRAEVARQLAAKEQTLPYVRALARASRDDAIARIDEAPQGPLTACAIGFHVDPDFPDLPDQQVLRCVGVGANAHRVELDVQVAQ